MKYIFTVLCFLLFMAHSSAVAILERRVTVGLSQVPLKSALDEVASKGGFKWSYNARIIDGKSLVSIDAEKWPVREVLLELLGDNYQFKPNGNYLILKKRRRPSSELSGYLKDPKTGGRIRNATVYDRKTLRATQTDENGYYELKVKKKSEVVISKLEYKDTVLFIESLDSRYQRVLLPPDSLPPDNGQISIREEAEELGYELERFFKATLDQVLSANYRDSLHRRGQVSFLPRMGTNRGLSSKVTNDWSLNVLAGVSRGNEIVEVGGLANFTQEYLEGFQVAGLFNVLQGDATGVQVAGIYNQTAGTLSGIQVAGIVNHSGHTRGLGLQVAGIVNVAKLGNSTVQVAGIVNTAEDCEGLQVAGIVNHAKRMTGVQIGLINNTKHLDGFQIGLVNKSDDRWMPFFNWGGLYLTQ